MPSDTFELHNYTMYSIDYHHKYIIVECCQIFSTLCAHNKDLTVKCHSMYHSIYVETKKPWLQLMHAWLHSFMADATTTLGRTNNRQYLEPILSICIP